MSIRSIGRNVECFFATACVELNKLRATENLNRIAYIINSFISNYNLLSGHPILAKLEPYSKDFAKITDFMGVLRIAHRWARPITTDTVFDKERVAQKLVEYMQTIQMNTIEIDQGLAAEELSVMAKEILKEAFAWKSIFKDGTYKNRSSLYEEVKVLLKKRANSLNEMNDLKNHVLNNIDENELDLAIPPVSWLERLSWVGYSMTSVLSATADMQEWNFYDLSAIASKIGLDKRFGSSSTLGTGVISALLAGHTFKFVESLRRTVVIQDSKDRLRNLWDIGIAFSNMGLYGARLVGVGPVLVNNLIIVVKLVELVGNATRPSAPF